MTRCRVLSREKVNIKDVKNILNDIGIELTPKECLELVKNLQVDDDGNIYESRLLDGVKSFKGGRIDINNLENVLENMKIKLPDKKLKDLQQKLPVGASGKIDLPELLKEIKKFIGGEIDAKVTRKVLGNIGINLTNREFAELLKILPIKDNGRVYRTELLDILKWFPGGTCHVSKIKPILEDMGYELEDEEIEDLRNHLSTNDDESMTKLNEVMENVKLFTGTKIDANEVDGVLKTMGIELTSKERWELLKTLPMMSDGKVYHNRLLDGLKTFRRGKVLKNKLETILESMNYSLEQNEMKDLQDHLKVDDNGKISLNSLMNTANLFSGDKINASDVQLCLGKVGIELTKDENKALLETVPLDDNKMVYKKRLIDGVKTYRRGKVNIDKIDDALETLGYLLDYEEIEELCDHLPVDDERRVQMNLLLDEVNEFLARCQSKLHT
uniref:uncharacterized protein LOC120884111 n=1 Tax=Ictidomys tridecemlineatus TaxID=43179 RepID=UPI001A9CD9A0|nr:uncharacterized protein LOC120884111 [Ictidomys tridecemlineatus]